MIFGCKRPVPLLVLFSVVSVLLMAIIIAALWVTWYHSAVNSVNDISEKLEIIVAKQLEGTVNNLFEKMLLILSTWSASDRLLELGDDDLERFTLNVASNFTQIKWMIMSRATGAMAGCARPTGGNLIVLSREASPISTPARANLTFWSIQPNQTRGIPLLSVDLDGRQRPWYINAMTQRTMTFTSPYDDPLDGTKVLILSTPAMHYSAVLAVGFYFSSFTVVLNEIADILQTSGMLVLLGNDGNQLAYKTSKETSALADIEEIKTLNWNKDQTVMSHDFKTFGHSKVLLVSIGDAPYDRVHAPGLQWKLIAVLPDRDYFSTIWNGNTFVAELTSVYFFIFLIIKILMFYVLITRPLNTFTKYLSKMADTLRSSAPQSSWPQIPFSSTLLEIRRLHKSLADTVEAAEAMTQMRMDELARNAREAHALMRSKDMFFAVMSHEMRTPLTACIGMAEVLLESTALDSRQTECVRAIMCSGSSMLALVNDILDFSKMQAERISAERMPFALRECVERVLGMLQLNAEEKGLELVSCIKSSVPDRVFGDEPRLGRVLLNIVGNAVKFTATGSVSLTISRDAGRSLKFEVVDTGIGMSTDCISRLFQPFMQADASMTRRYGGTGLGLVISKQIVEAMGGSLQVESQGEGHGSKFTFVLPLVPSNVEGGNNPDTVDGAGTNRYKFDRNLRPRVLLVDSCKPRREALYETLLFMNTEPYVLDSPQKLVDAFPRTPAVEASIVIAHSSQLCSTTSSREEIASILQTAPRGQYQRSVIWVVMMKQAENVLPSHRIISMPLTTTKVYNALQGAIAGSFSGGSSQGTLFETHQLVSNNNNAPPSTSMSSQPASGGVLSTQSAMSNLLPNGTARHERILIVDDVAVNQRVLSMKLQQRGFHELYFANDGEEAVAAVHRAPFIFDFILMDVMMPKMDGYEATQRIRLIPKYSEVPIIGVTGNCAADDIRKCLEAGMSAAIGKPIDTKKLMGLLGIPSDSFELHTSATGGKLNR